MSKLEFNQLLLNNADFMKPFAINLTRDSEAAKDLYQETLFKAIANKEKYNVGTNIKAWSKNNKITADYGNQLSERSGNISTSIFALSTICGQNGCGSLWYPMVPEGYLKFHGTYNLQNIKEMEF